MSRVYHSIQGCPFRKVVSRVRAGVNGGHTEKLSCGHTHTVYPGEAFGSKRRCYTCKSEKESGIRK